MNYELIGYVASVLVAISLTMSSILRLRLINLAGAAIFAIYGVLIGAAPVAAVNIFIVGVNIYYLAKIFGAREYFRLLEVSADSEYLEHFLELNRVDILRYEPQAVTHPLPHHLTLFVLRGVIPAGLVIGERVGGGTLHVHLDYVLPGYRDFKVGNFLYGHDEFFRERGISRVVTQAENRVHARYLRRMGFREETTGRQTRFVRDV